MMPAALRATDRAVLEVKGAEARGFLQGLITNDMARLDAAPVLYAAILTPQGKYLFDFFVVARDGDFLIDVKADRAPLLAQRLAMYRLRAKVEIAPTGLAVVLGTGDPPDGAWPDPRDARIGWRAIVADPWAFLAGMGGLDPAELLARRIALAVPESGVELAPDDAYILEMGFERLNGVDFRKGCYVGQEVTARMKHKTELKKGLARVTVEGPAPAAGTEVTADGRAAGTLYSVAGGEGLAYLRFDRADRDMRAGEATVRLPKDFRR
jgi:hypothetical protein